MLYRDKLDCNFYTLSFVAKARSLPLKRRGVKRSKGLHYSRPALPANIRLGWKWLTVTDTLAYYDTETITAIKVL